jgi:argininosuccinate lyase
MPGFTHTRAAMPSSAGLWSACLAELLLDDLVLLDAAYELIDQSPLGSAAGYGVPIKLDREFTAEQLGFAKVQKNVLAVQNGRGKFELALVSACQQIMIDLSRAAADIILFSLPEFGFITIPDELTTGSSIMPQKRNPDPMELIRAATHSVNGAAASLAGTLTGLISGYNRDLQLTKGPTMKAIDTCLSSLAIMNRMFAGITVNEKRCIEGFSPDIFAADAALEMVLKEKVPFREAYKFVAGRLGDFGGFDPKKTIKSRKHTGAAGNLGLEAEKKRVSICAAALEKRIAKIDSAFESLMK